MGTKTYTATSFFDADSVIASFTSQGLKDIPDSSHATVGFLYCDSQVDYVGVVEKLSALVSFPIVGGTTMGLPFDNTPHDSADDMSAMLLVIEREGMRVSVQASEKLNHAQHTEQMNALYAKTCEELGEEPKIAMLFLPLLPGIPLSDFMDDIFVCAGDIPVFGGTSTNDLISTQAAVFHNGESLHDKLVLVLIGGNVRPVCASSCQVTPMVEYAPTVSQVEGNEVLRVDSSSFCDYMRDIGLNPEDRVSGVDALMQYGPTPVLVDTGEAGKTDVPEIRCISYTDLERGSGMFSAAVAEGAKIYMSILRQQDVIDSARECLSKLEERMTPARQEGYEYTAFFCVTCVARYFVQVGGSNKEKEFLMDNIPAGCHPTGLYAFCEIGPVYSAKDGFLQNRSHSGSITMCAF